MRESVKGGRLNLSGAIYDMNIQRAPNIYAIDCYSEGMILDVSRLVQEAHKTIIGAIYHPKPENIRGVARARIKNTLQHDAIAERPQPLPTETVLRNDSEQALHLWVTICCQPTPDKPATCSLFIDLAAETLTNITQEESPENNQPDTHTLYLRIPPW